MDVMRLEQVALAGDFVRYWVLISIFGGDPDAWLRMLPAKDDQAWAAEDRAFLVWLKLQIANSPDLLHAIREAADSAEAFLLSVPMRPVQ